MQSLFPSRTTILGPSSSSVAINPSELSARGAAIQASLIQDFEKEDIDQSTHPMVTVTPHLPNAIGLQIGSEDTFAVMVAANSAVPIRKVKQFKAPEGDVLVRVCEIERQILVTRPEPGPETNGNKDSDDEHSELESGEEEDLRERVWKAKKTLAEFALKDQKKGGKIEVMVNIGGDMSVSITAREVGGKGGIRGSLHAPEVVENGNA